MDGRYSAPYSVYMNDSLQIAAGANLTITFKDTNGNNTRAKRVHLRIDAAGGHSGEVYRKPYNRHGAVVAAAAGDFYFLAGESMLELPFYTAQINVLNSDAAVACTVYYEAFSDEDITGTTIA